MCFEQLALLGIPHHARALDLQGREPAAAAELQLAKGGKGPGSYQLELRRCQTLRGPAVQPVELVGVTECVVEQPGRCRQVVIANRERSLEFDIEGVLTDTVLEFRGHGILVGGTGLAQPAFQRLAEGSCQGGNDSTYVCNQTQGPNTDGPTYGIGYFPSTPQDAIAFFEAKCRGANVGCVVSHYQGTQFGSTNPCDFGYSATCSDRPYLDSKQWYPNPYYHNNGRGCGLYCFDPPKSAPVKETPSPPSSVGLPGEKNSEQYAASVEALAGKPYKLGANGPDAYDCSSTVCYGIRTVSGTFGDYTADQIYKKFVTPLSGREELQIGDLIFYDYTSDGTIDHVATALSQGKMLHPSSGAGALQIKSIDYLDGYTHQRGGKIYYGRIDWGAVGP